jgi:hypothetical protein
MSNSGALPRDALLRQYVQMAEIEIDHSRRGPRGRRPARYVFLGDYIDRGPDSRGGVIQLLMRRQQAQPGTSVCLRGNHAANGDYGARERARPAVVAAERGRGHPVQLFGTNGRIEDSHLARLRTLPLCHDMGIIRAGRLPAYIQSRSQISARIAFSRPDEARLGEAKGYNRSWKRHCNPRSSSLDNAGTR